MKRILAALGTTAILLTGATACSDGDTEVEYVVVVQYGYYDSHHKYHYYSTPKQVRVKNSFYKKNQYQYQPHGNQKTVTIHKSTTTVHKDGSRTTKRTTTTTTRKSGKRR